MSEKGWCLRCPFGGDDYYLVGWTFSRTRREAITEAVDWLHGPEERRANRARLWRKMYRDGYRIAPVILTEANDD